MPAWLVCEDMLTKAKDELILEAIDVLHEEIKAKRIDINGYVSVLPDKPDELQRDMYIINNLLIHDHEIKEQYSSYIHGSTKEKSPEVVARSEELRRFLLAIDAISMLMDFSNELGNWAEDTGTYINVSDTAEILMKSMGLGVHRLSILGYLLKSKRFLGSGALSKGELKLLSTSLHAQED